MCTNVVNMRLGKCGGAKCSPADKQATGLQGVHAPAWPTPLPHRAQATLAGRTQAAQLLAWAMGGERRMPDGRWPLQLGGGPSISQRAAAVHPDAVKVYGLKPARNSGGPISFFSWPP